MALNFSLTIQLQQQLHCYWWQPKLSHYKFNTASSETLQTYNLEEISVVTVSETDTET